MDILKELIFVVGACTIVRSDVKHGITDIPKKSKSEAINVLDKTINMATELMRSGFPPGTTEDFKKEILESFSRLANEQLEAIRSAHIVNAKENSLVAKKSEIH